MEFLTSQEVAKILRCSEWFVYQNRSLLGGIKIGKLVRFDKEIFESKIKEVIDNGSLQTSREMELRFLEEQSQTPEKRISNEARSKSGRGRSPKKSKTDEFGLHRLMREQT
jgi:hypothetical protein